MFLGGLLASADPREPKYSVGQSHFFAHQRFSVSVAFGGPKRHSQGTFLPPFGSFLEVFLDVFLEVFFRVVFETFFVTFWHPFGLLVGPWGCQMEEKKGTKLMFFRDPPSWDVSSNSTRYFLQTSARRF